jgi:hypothetical protein
VVCHKLGNFKNGYPARSLQKSIMIFPKLITILSLPKFGYDITAAPFTTKWSPKFAITARQLGTLEKPETYSRSIFTNERVPLNCDVQFHGTFCHVVQVQ